MRDVTLRPNPPGMRPALPAAARSLRPDPYELDLEAELRALEAGEWQDVEEWEILPS